MATAMTTLLMPGPSTAMMPMASSSQGKASRMSIRRMIT